MTKKKKSNKKRKKLNDCMHAGSNILRMHHDVQIVYVVNT